jgi:hypothetical protein
MTPDTPHEADDDAVEAADEKAAQLQRAKRLREEIARIKGKAGGSPSDEPPANSERPESPRDFTDRKAREAGEDQER